jgi:hypothetical protein
MLKTWAVGVLTIVVAALVFVGGSLRAQVTQRDRDREKPATLPAFPANAPLPQPPQAQLPTYPQYPQRPPVQPQPVPLPQPLPPQNGGSTINLIPSFLNAGRTYAFQPAVGDPFVARVIVVDATGWVQVQRQPVSSNIGPIAEWYNLQNVVAMKAQ